MFCKLISLFRSETEDSSCQIQQLNVSESLEFLPKYRLTPEKTFQVFKKIRRSDYFKNYDR